MIWCLLGCWLVGVPPVAGAMELTVIQQSLTVYLSVRPRRSKVCSHGFAVLRYPGSAHSKLFDDDMPIRHHALPDHEFVFGPSPTPLLLPRQLRWRSLGKWTEPPTADDSFGCMVSPEEGYPALPLLMWPPDYQGCEVCYQLQPGALLHLACLRGGVCVDFPHCEAFPVWCAIPV